jgi:hypothetical protein
MSGIKINDIEFDENQNYDLSTTIESADSIKKQIKDIISQCLAMNRSNMDEYKQICLRKFTNFHQKYPSLFFKIIENPSTFPMYRIEEMLKIKKKIEKNEIEQEKAAVYFGDKYYKEFVKETVDKLDKNLNLKE